MVKKPKANKVWVYTRLIIIGILIGVVSWALFDIGRMGLTDFVTKLGFSGGYMINIAIIVVSIVVLLILGVKPVKAFRGKL